MSLTQSMVLPAFFLARPPQNAIQLLQQPILVLFNLRVSARSALRRRNFFVLEPQQRQRLIKSIQMARFLQQCAAAFPMLEPFVGFDLRRAVASYSAAKLRR